VGPRRGQLPTGPSESTLRSHSAERLPVADLPRSTYANQIVSDEEKVCTRSHQTFERDQARLWVDPGLNRGASR
jgi:hypothetical protein